MAKVLLPLVLQRLAENKEEVDVVGSNIYELLENLEHSFPGTKKLIAPTDKIQDFVNIYINGNDIRLLDNENSLINETDNVNIVLAVSGG